MTTYSGSCACKRITFEADLDLSAGSARCNCTSCWKRRYWGIRAKPEGFRVLSGAGELHAWKPVEGGPSGFCKHCGVVTFLHTDAAEWNDGAYVSVNVAALDGLDAATLAAIPVTYLDGLHDTWEPIAGDTSYL